jgi:cell division protein FtsA
VEVDVHCIHGILNRLQNSIRAVQALQLEVEDLVFNGVASAVALLNTQQKELGSLVIDMGGGITEYVVYTRGVIKHTGVLALGGDHLSNDLAYGLKVPLGRAEQLKIDHGSALVNENVRGQTIGLANEFALQERSVSLEHLRRIMSLRLEETFELIAEELDQAGVLDFIREGVFLCGGCSRIPEIQKLASRTFGLPVFIGKANSVSGIKSALDQPEFATAIGLLRCGSFELKKRADTKSSFTGAIKRSLGQLFGIGT